MKELSLDIEKVRTICRENDVASLGVFGSVARGEETETSDIDMLVRFTKRKSLLALVALERKFSRALGKKVDLLTEAALSPYLKDDILKEVKVIYEAG
jgi:predicted nucleotidyltransferase